MRDLRMELRQWNDGNPIEWKPTAGDILVGFIRHDFSADSEPARSSVIIEEERTNIPVLVSLVSEQLSALFELHNPRANERVGIKYTGKDSNGVDRFLMVVDRDNPINRTSDKQRKDTTSDCETDDDGEYSAFTPEERRFFEEMLSPEESGQSACCFNSRINGMLSRQEEELARQTRALEKLGVLINRPPSGDFGVDNKPDGKQACQSSTAPPATVIAVMEKRRTRWLRSILTGLALSAVLITTAAFILIRPTLLDIWNKLLR